MKHQTPKPQVDTSKPHPARVYDWLLGGKDNYPVDQEVGKRLPQMMKDSARQNRAFMHRAMAWLAGQGVEQFLDIGTGIPTEPNLHQIVQGINPAARIVYADNDPIVLAHAAALLVSTPDGTTDYIDADVRQPLAILEHARTHLDFRRPVAVSLIALLHFIQDSDDPYEITRTLVGALAPGSFLVLSHGTFDFHQELGDQVTGAYSEGGIGLTSRSRGQMERFFHGLDLVSPGLVTAERWHKDDAVPADQRSAVYAGVGAL